MGVCRGGGPPSPSCSAVRLNSPLLIPFFSNDIFSKDIILLIEPAFANCQPFLKCFLGLNFYRARDVSDSVKLVSPEFVICFREGQR